MKTGRQPQDHLQLSAMEKASLHIHKSDEAVDSTPLSPQELELEEAYKTYRPLLLEVLSTLSRQGYVVPLLDGLDLIHAFFEEAWSRLITTYDPERGSFLPYLHTAFARFARRRIVRLSKFRSQYVHADDLTQLQIVADQDSHENPFDIGLVARAVHALPRNQRELLEAYLENPSERTLADQFGISRYRVHETLAVALARVAVSLDRPKDVPELDWAVTSAVLGEGRTIQQAAARLGLSPSKAKERYTYTLKTLIGSLQGVGPIRYHKHTGKTMGMSPRDLLRTALVGPEGQMPLRELSERASEVLAYLDTLSSERELGLAFQDIDAERLSLVFDALGKGAYPEEAVRLSEEEQESLNAFLRAEDSEAEAVGRAFKDALVEGLPPRLVDFASYFAALPVVNADELQALMGSPAVREALPEAAALAERGLSPITFLYATEAVAGLIDRSFRYEDLRPDDTVRLLLREGNGITVEPETLNEQMFVEEVEDMCECDEQTARILLRWVVEAAEYRTFLLRRLQANPTTGVQGVELKRSRLEFKDLYMRWKPEKVFA